jgi:hypothetical protein
MADMILDVQILPEPIFSRIHTPKVKIHEKNGSIISTPLSEEKPCFDHLIGIFSDGKMSIINFYSRNNWIRNLKIE